MTEQRTVKCKKLECEAAGLDAPPFEGELGDEIFENVSAEAWAMWKGDMMIKIINEYRLDLTNPEHYNVLLQQMKAFLNLESSEEVLEVENEERGKSGD